MVKKYKMPCKMHSPETTYSRQVRGSAVRVVIAVNPKISKDTTSQNLPYICM
jgi:hypothetical protein